MIKYLADAKLLPSSISWVNIIHTTYECFCCNPKDDVYLHPDLHFWTQLIAQGGHIRL